MSLSLLTEYKGNGQPDQLPTNLFAVEEMTEQKKEQIRKLMEEARKETIDWAKVECPRDTASSTLLFPLWSCNFTIHI